MCCDVKNTIPKCLNGQHFRALYVFK